MAEEKLLTIREVSSFLGISEKEVIELSESGAVPAYKIGGVYLRFKRSQIEEYRKKHLPHLRKDSSKVSYSLGDRISDFFYFNDFYVLSLILIILILIVIFQGYK